MENNKTIKTSTKNHILDEAISLAARGIPVFPLVSKGKKPLTKNGFKDASTDKEQIMAWWEQYPDANLGMPTGKASGVFVLDVDPRHNGDASYKDLIAKYGELPETYIVITGGGGLHIYFANPDVVIRNSANQLADGLDIRGEGGYVVVPPSITDNEYKPKNTLKLQDAALAPQWLIDLIEKPSSPEKTTKEEWKELEIVEGERNTKLTSIAGTLRHKGLGYDVILATLLATNKQHLNDPLAEDEIRSIARSVATNYQPSDAKPDETDVGNALLLKIMFGGSMLYCHVMKEWLFWNGKYWQENGTGEPERKCMEMINFYAAKFSKTHLKRAKSPTGIRAILEIAKNLPDMYVTMPELDSKHWLLNLNNGTLNLNKREISSHNPKDLMTKILPIDFEPKAEAPRFKHFMQEIMCNSSEMVEFLQRFMGYCLTGEIKEAKFFTFYGDGANGKSTLINIIHIMLGRYAVAAQGSTFLHRRSERIRNDIASLVGARFVSAVEIDPDDKLDEVLIKQITGGDKISVRKLYCEPFELSPTFKVVLGVNRLPAITGTDHGIWRRVCIIPFNATFDAGNQDKDLLQKLENEKSGILNWMLDGLIEWKKQGLNAPPEVSKASDDYRSKMDSLALFINEECEKDDNYMVRTSQFNETYARWCRDYGYYPISRRDLVPSMKAKNFPREKRQGGYLHYVGIELKDNINRIM